jgi:hypothetical protein
MNERITTDKLTAEADKKAAVLLVYRNDKGKSDAVKVPMAQFQRWLVSQWRKGSL